MDFATRAARSGIAHFPEIVFFISSKYSILTNPFFPLIISFLIESQFFFCITFENGYIQSVFFQTIYCSQQLPTPLNGFFFEVVAKTPVAKHFKHSVVISVHTNFFKVVVLTAYTQTFLRIGNSLILDGFIAEENIFERSHTAVDEHQRRVVLHHYGCTGHNLVTFTFEKF